MYKTSRILVRLQKRSFSLNRPLNSEQLFESQAPSGPLGKKVFDLSHDNFEIPKIPAPEAKHGVLTCTATFQGYMPDHLEFVAYFSRYSAHAMGLPCSPTIHQDTVWERWSMARGPFVHGTKQEVFERKTYSRILQIFDGSPEMMNTWVKYVNSKLPSGVDFKVDMYSWKSLEYLSQLESKLSNENEKKSKGIDDSLVKSKQEAVNFDQKVRNRAAEILKKLSS